MLISVVYGELHLNLGINQNHGMMFLAGQSHTKYSLYVHVCHEHEMLSTVTYYHDD